MATFVDFGTEQEHLVELRNFISKWKTGKEESKESSAATTTTTTTPTEAAATTIDWNTVIDSLLGEFQTLLTMPLATPAVVQSLTSSSEPSAPTGLTDKEVEGFFFTLLSILKRIGSGATTTYNSADTNFLHKTLPRLISTLTVTTESAPPKTSLRLKLLNHLYNVVNKNSSDRYEIFMTILKYASSTRNGEVVLSSLGASASVSVSSNVIAGPLNERDALERAVEGRVNEWGIDTKQKRVLFKAIRDMIRESNKSVSAYRWSIKYLSTFDGAEESCKEAVDESVKAIVEAIKSPEIFHFEAFTHVGSVRSLEKSENRIFQLIKIFIGETLEAFKSFHDQNGIAFFNQQELNYDDCVRKMRLLTLASLASSQQELPYSTISKALQISESEVELWIVTAISENLISAKMDQIKKSVRVTRSLQRVFTKIQWKQLNDSLNMWKNNVKMLLDTVQHSKQQLHSEFNNLQQQYQHQQQQH